MQVSYDTAIKRKAREKIIKGKRKEMVNEGVFELRVERMMKRRAAGGQRAQFTKSSVFGCWHKASIDTQVQTKSSKVAKYQVPMYPCTYYPASHRPPIRYLAVSRLSFSMFLNPVRS